MKRFKDKEPKGIFGAVTDADRDTYSSEVVRVEAVPNGLLSLEVKVFLACGHDITGIAAGAKRKVPKRLFCKMCYGLRGGLHVVSTPATNE